MATQRETILTLDRLFTITIIYDDVTRLTSGLEIVNNHPRSVVVSINGGPERTFRSGESVTISLVKTFRKSRFINEEDQLAVFPISSLTARII